MGVGNNIMKEELKKIAMGEEKNVFQVSEFENLYDELQPIINMSCIKSGVSNTFITS